jgi:hypothetical protein
LVTSVAWTEKYCGILIDDPAQLASALQAMQAAAPAAIC